MRRADRMRHAESVRSQRFERRQSLVGPAHNNYSCGYRVKVLHREAARHPCERLYQKEQHGSERNAVSIV